MDIAHISVRHALRMVNFVLFISSVVIIGWLVFRTETGKLDEGTQWAMITRAGAVMIISMLMEALFLQPKPTQTGGFPLYDEQEQE